MSETRHTSGPWVASAQMASVSTRPALDAKPTVICRMQRSPHQSRPTMQANCLLISAAPDLLIACERLLAVLDGKNTFDHAFALEYAREAVAKAKGV